MTQKYGTVKRGLDEVHGLCQSHVMSKLEQQGDFPKAVSHMFLCVASIACCYEVRPGMDRWLVHDVGAAASIMDSTVSSMEAPRSVMAVRRWRTTLGLE